jgi:CBS domain containing-hemolysin-like protein
VIPALVIVALVVLNGVFVAAEFAIVGAPRAALARRAAAGNRIARFVGLTISDPRRMDRFIAAAQLGITGASLGLGMYGEHALAQGLVGWLEGLGAARWVAAHTIASVLAISWLTFLHIVIGEMVPKALALQHPERTARWVTPFMRVFQIAMYPLVVALNGLGNGLLRLMGIDRRAHSGEHYPTAEEIEHVVRESQAGGLLRKESAEVVQELLEFSDLTAGEIMVPRVRITGIPVGTTPDDLRAVIRTTPHTRYPVYRKAIDHVIGAVHIKDLLRLLSRNAPLTAAEARLIPFVPETATTESVLAAMRRSHSQMAVVMDEHGGTAGLVTIEDLFEEVVGEIDEGTATRPDIYRDASGRLHVAGTVRIEEVGEQFNLILEHEEVDTVSGLVLSLLGRPPAVGDAVVYGSVRFEVIEIEGNGVREAVASVPVDTARDEDLSGGGSGLASR